MNCPLCIRKLEKNKNDAVGIWECQSCGAKFFILQTSEQTEVIKEKKLLREATIFFKRNKIPIPEIGQKIYVDSHFSDGYYTFFGGICEISKVQPGVSSDKPTFYVEVVEEYGALYNIISLYEKQEKLKEEFGDRVGSSVYEEDYYQNEEE